MVNKTQKIKFLFWLALPLIMTLVILGNVNTARATLPPSGVPHQCKNGDMNQAADCTAGNPLGWRNSSANPSNSQYGEGDTIPYRQVLDDLTAGNTYCFGFGWDVTNASLPAIDYLTTFNRSLPLADPTVDTVHAGNLGTPDDIEPIPSDPVITSGYIVNPANSFMGTLPATRDIYVWGGTFTAPPVFTSPGGDVATEIQNSLEYCILSSSTEIVIAVGGHIAIPEDWGLTDRPTGAPYHLANGTWNGYFTAPRTGESSLICLDPLGNVEDDRNVGRSETQLQIGDNPLAINLQGVAATSGSTSDTLPVALGFTMIAALTAYILLRPQDAKIIAD